MRQKPQRHKVHKEKLLMDEVNTLCELCAFVVKQTISIGVANYV
jgi:hypothetical protein